MVSSPKVLVFDAEGVLFKTARETGYALARSYGVSLDVVDEMLGNEEVMKEVFAGRGEGFFSLVESLTGLKATPGYMLQFVASTGRPRMYSAFNRLRESYKTAMMVSAPVRLFEISNRLNRIDKSFDKVFVSGYRPAAAPDPEAYLDVAMSFGVAPEECAYFSGVEERVLGASSVGMKATFISSPQDLIHEMDKLGIAFTNHVFDHPVPGGMYGLEIGSEAAREVGAALATALGQGSSIAVSTDSTRSARNLRSDIVGGCISAGAAVKDLGVLPLPLLYLAVEKMGLDGGVGVYTSEHYSHYMTLRFWFRERAFSEAMEEVKRVYREKSFARAQGSFSTERIQEEFVHSAAAVARPLQGRKIRVCVKASPAWAQTTTAHLLEIAKGAGIEYAECPVDADVSAGTMRMGADMGAELDDLGGVRIVDEKGKEAEDSAILLSAMPGSRCEAILDHANSELLAKQLEQKGCSASMVCGGPEDVMEAARGGKASIGYSYPRRYYFGEVGHFSSLLAIARVAERLSESGKALSEVPAPEYSRQIVIEGDEGSVETVAKALEGAVKGAGCGDAVRATVDGGFVFLQRLDKSMIRLIVRGRSEAERDAIFEHLTTIATEALSSIPEEPGVVQRL